MKKHNILVTVNGVSKSRAQWAKELGVTKGAISLRESKGESASSAIAEIIGTVHTRKILEHYVHARAKHPYFCDSLYPKAYTRDEAQCRCKAELSFCRELIKEQISNGILQWDLLLNCEVWKAHEAIANGDTAHAIEECYDAIAVLLRTIDVLEGRQKLGKPEMKGETK